MSRSQSGPLATYNSLTDKHLTGYFNNTRIRRHLQRVGLVTRSGRIVSEKEYRLNVVRKDHQKYVRETLAQAIFHKVLNMERHHRQEVRKRLEDLARRGRVQRIKVERMRRSEEDVTPFLSPRPPASRNCHRSLLGPNVMQSRPATSSSSPRPSTAPGKMQRPARLIPLPSNEAPGTAAITVHSSPHTKTSNQQVELVRDINARSLHGQPDREAMRNWHTVDFPSGPSPYRLPVINNYVTPVPPPLRQWEKSGFTRGRRLRPTTAPHAPNGLDPKLQRTEEVPRWRRSAGVHSNVLVTMVYRGKRLHLSYDGADARDEVKVHQQHCGGENLCVFKGKLLEAERFQFVSRRHAGFPFSLTFFLNGIQVHRLSSCCEFRHRRGSRLGGRHPHFALLSVQGAAPCYRCIIATGLDKKPSPPPRRVKEDLETGRESGKRGSARPGRGTLRAVKAAETVQDGATSAVSSLEEDGMAKGRGLTESLGNSGHEYADDFEEDEEKPRRGAESWGRGSAEMVGDGAESGSSGQEGRAPGSAQQRESMSSTSDSEGKGSTGSGHSRPSSPDLSSSSRESDGEAVETGVQAAEAESCVAGEGAAGAPGGGGCELEAMVGTEAAGEQAVTEPLPGTKWPLRRLCDGEGSGSSADGVRTGRVAPETGGEQEPGPPGDGRRVSTVDASPPLGRPAAGSCESAGDGTLPGVEERGGASGPSDSSTDREAEGESQSTAGHRTIPEPETTDAGTPSRPRGAGSTFHCTDYAPGPSDHTARPEDAGVRPGPQGGAGDVGTVGSGAP
ncbi:glutamate-rich protein 3 isoform X2 [Pristis pectinata]|uniref:glutamate-rich protein 3 isoform X2 n=1 Tax=Pristis pectinata TaxID=685728 RepID=UPI00223CA2FF|nr:glutamate-rich protein 3 isoform X2 [Pristis pectinata]